MVLSVTQADAQKLLRWKLQAGESLRLTFDQDMIMETSIMGNEIKSTADMAMVLNWNVRQVGSDGVADIVQSIERLHMKMQTPGGDPVEYDSAQPTQPQGLAKTLADSIQPLVGIEFVQRMNDRGEIIDVRLSDRGVAQLATAPAATQLQEIFSKQGMKSLLHQAATVLPEGPVKPGDRWKGVSETKSPVGKLVMDMTYTYRGTEIRDGRPLERIDVEVKVGFGEGPNALGLDVDVKEQQNSGSMYFDVAAGRFTDSVLRQSMTLETAVGEKTHRQKLDTQLRMRFASDHVAVAKTAARPSSETR